MEYYHYQKPVSIFEKSTFARPFDGCFVVLNKDDVEMSDGGDFKPNRLVTLLPECFNNYDWGGEFWFIPKEYSQQFLSFADTWHKKLTQEIESQGFDNENDNGISESLFYMHTPNGLFVLDTTYVDFGSHSSELVKEFINENNISEGVIRSHDDCHMVSNINIPRFYRDISTQEFFKFLVEENVLSDDVFISSLKHSIGKNTLITDKKIVMTGTFSREREAIKEVLIGLGFKVADKVTGADCWLWTGQKTGQNKIAAAQKFGAKVSNVAELLDELFINNPRYNTGTVSKSLGM